MPRQKAVPFKNISDAEIINTAITRIVIWGLKAYVCIIVLLLILKLLN